jgi:signal transduction histidine kinase
MDRVGDFVTSLLKPSLRRTLLARSFVIGIVPIVIIGTLAIGVSQRLLLDRFNDEAEVVANATASGIADRITLTSRASAVLSALPAIRDLTTAGDARGLRELLIPLKSRLGLDLAFISDRDGVIIAGAQDFAPGDKLPAELVVRAQARAELSYVIYTEPRGLMIRAITPISSGSPASPPGFVEVGSLLDDSFLKTLRASSDSEIAVLVEGKAVVSSLADLDTSGLPRLSETDLLVAPYRSEVVIAGQRYAAIFTLLQSHSAHPQQLVVFLPLAPLEDAQRQIAAAVIVGGIVLGALSILLSYRTARSMTMPLARLATAARRIEEGDLSTPVQGGSRYEIGQLEHSFGSMAGALWTRDNRNETLVAELRGANVKLEEANRLKNEFIANVSHELRTPMNAILGYTDFLLEGLNGPLTESQYADLDRVRTAARNLLGIINGLIDLAKIEAGQMDVQPAHFDVSTMTAKVIELVEDQAGSKQLTLRAELESDLPQAWADPHQIQQVLLNLTGNAIKFTAKGEIVISAAVANDVIEVVVTDTGEGIPTEAQAFIFDEFRQADGSSRRRHGGTGLGLALARRFVWMNGGKIWVESTAGRGSKFHFTVPLQPRAARTAVPALSLER